MKDWTLILALFTALIGCKRSEISSFNLNNSTAENEESPKVIKISAARDYNPPIWYRGEYIFIHNGAYILPSEIEVISGSSWNGWVSVLIQERKFCYQGNMYNSDLPPGYFFLFKHETDSLNTCSSINKLSEQISTINLSPGDIILINVEGGGCHSQCSYTEIEFTMEKF